MKSIAARRWPEKKSPLVVHAPGSSLIARFFKLFTDIAYVAMIALSVIMLIAFVIAIFIPLTDLSITIDNGGEARLMPLTRSLLLLALGMITAYFAGFCLILNKLRLLFRTLLAGLPFVTENVHRLQQIATVLSVVTLGGWIGRLIVARDLVPGTIDEPDVTQLFTPTFAIVIIFLLAEFLREGTRLKRDSELTI